MVQELVQEIPSINDVNRVGGIESADLFIDAFLSRSVVALGITERLMTTADHKGMNTTTTANLGREKSLAEIPAPIQPGGTHASFQGIPAPYKK